MGFEQRRALIRKIEELRGSKVICYLTSLRFGQNAQISDDHVRVFFDQLRLLPNRKAKLDIFLCSDGGTATVPWRLIPTCREFAEEIGVLVPFRAYSAATQIALGADQIVMHPFGELGPVDPAVANEFNPRDKNTNEVQRINVEDVVSYVEFIKKNCGITHEDELIRAIDALTREVHPLAIGNVARFIAQSRLIAKKLLKSHKQKQEEHRTNEIVEHLNAKLYFHAHAINRKEAIEELKLDVVPEVSPDLESAMWDLYLDFEAEFSNQEFFVPLADLNSLAARKAEATAARLALEQNEIQEAVARLPNAAEIIAVHEAAVERLKQLLQDAIANNDATQISQLSAALAQTHQALCGAHQMRAQLSQQVSASMGQFFAQSAQAERPPAVDYELTYSIIESDLRSSKYVTKERYSLMPLVGNPGAEWLKRELLSQRWEHSVAT
jgi:serine dehydrogenase proteinase